MIDYKPFFWNDMIEGKHTGGYQVGSIGKMNNGKEESNEKIIKNKITNPKGVPPPTPPKGGSIPNDDVIERFRNLVVPIGFVLLNENNVPRKYNEHSNVETIDDAMFDKLFYPLVVNKGSKKRTTRKKRD
jgi:hypothetical protein